MGSARYFYVSVDLEMKYTIKVFYKKYVFIYYWYFSGSQLLCKFGQIVKNGYL